MNDEYLWATYDFHDLSLLRFLICGFTIEITFQLQRNASILRDLGLEPY